MFVVLSLLLALAGGRDEAWATVGRVEVHVTDHRPGKADFSALEVALGEVTLHPAAQPRGGGWVALVHDTPAVDIVPLVDGRSAWVGEADVEATRYDAVRVRFGTIQARLRGSGRAVVVPRGSALAVDLSVAAGAVSRILIDLYVEDQRDHHPDQYALAVRAVRVEQPARQPLRQ